MLQMHDPHQQCEKAIIYVYMYVRMYIDIIYTHRERLQTRSQITHSLEMLRYVWNGTTYMYSESVSVSVSRSPRSTNNPGPI